MQAERLFSEVRRIESYRVEGMEIYSTTLWHLQKDVALSALSKDLTDMDKNCPEVARLQSTNVLASAAHSCQQGATSTFDSFFKKCRIHLAL